MPTRSHPLHPGQRAGHVPDEPSGPEVPSPDTPDQPEVPNPDVPAKPESPGGPEKPAKPEVPEPEAPQSPTNPDSDTGEDMESVRAARRREGESLWRRPEKERLRSSPMRAA